MMKVKLLKSKSKNIYVKNEEFDFGAGQVVFIADQIFYCF